MSKAKSIAVGGGFEVRFLQRARGQETRFWDGEILKNGALVATFRNGGHGGATLISTPAVREAFKRMVAECPRGSEIDFESETLVLAYAEAKGYDRTAKDLTLAELVGEFAREIGEVG